MVGGYSRRHLPGSTNGVLELWDIISVVVLQEGVPDIQYLEAIHYW
jgi:hypothetical protein